jgi:DNA-binding response OmpR family regulator
MRLLLVEDARDLASALVDGLTRHGFVVDLCTEGEAAIDLALTQPYTVLILDRMLPGIDGLSVCHTLRARGSSLPILMLTARDTVEDRVQGLEAGADDYLIKPFAFPELLARVRALGRRQMPLRPETLQVRDVILDLTAGRATRGGHDLHLSAKEWRLLSALLRHPGRLLSHEQLLDQAWNMDGAPSPEVLRAHIKNLRRKLAEHGEGGLIETVIGLGYRLAT